MAGSDALKHQNLVVSIGGSVVDKHAVSFRLQTASGFHAVAARLLYPADSDVGNVDDDITVSLITDDKTDLYFTGKIYSAALQDSKRELLLTDSYKKLCDGKYAAAYRKEKAAAILEDILGAAGIRDTLITCPEVELARFSTPTMPCRQLIDLLIDALKEHGFTGLAYFFDAKDVFHFGTASDTGINEGEAYTFESAKNILKTGPLWLETLPAPIRHTQKVTVNGTELLTLRTDVTISGKRSRLAMYLGEVL
ncbi:hypothetical protein Holit_02236 [Hollandina sp. SP2]